MNNKPKDWEFNQQQSQAANSEVTELEVLRSELRELKEEIKNKQDTIRPFIISDIAVFLMAYIGGSVLMCLIVLFITLLYMGVISLLDKDNSSSPSITLPKNSR